MQEEGSLYKKEKIYSTLFFLVAVLFLILGTYFDEEIASDVLVSNENYSFSADVYSEDNFYDAELGKYQDVIYSDTTLSYNVLEKMGDVLLYKNMFDAKTSEGEPIFFVEKLYGVDKKTGMHVSGYGDQDRVGYLFAPKENWSKENFDYWHINYDDPAHMEFQSVEKLYTIDTYKYYAEFQSDQTKYLSILPGVPEERGVELDVKLTTWVDPLSGLLINYQDEAVAYYYDIETGERLEPWNKFTNTFREFSVLENVQSAQSIHEDYAKNAYHFKIISYATAALMLLLMILTLKFKQSMVVSLGVIVSSAGFAVMLGWFMEIGVLKSFIPGLVTMKFTTALAFFFSGIIIVYSYLRLRDNIIFYKERFAYSITILTSAMIILLFMATLFISTLFGFQVGIEDLFVKETGELIQTVVAGRPSVGTMINFLLISLIALLTVHQTCAKNLKVYILGVLMMLLSVVALVGYAIDMPALYWVHNGVSGAMAVHTAFLFLLMSISVIAIGQGKFIQDQKKNHENKN